MSADRAAWTAWPRTKLGWASIVLAVISVALFAGLSLWAEMMSQRLEPSAPVLNIGVIPAVLGLVSIILGWLSLVLRKDRSAILLVVTIMMSLQVLFVIVFEVLEVLL